MEEEKQQGTNQEEMDNEAANQARPGFKRLARLQRKEEFLPSFSKSFVSFAVEVFKVVLISLAIIIPIRYFLIQPFYVNGASMEPNFHDNEYLVINEISYRFSDPGRGDVVVLKSKINAKEYLIKRIIGLPGEKVEIAGGKVTIFNDKNPTGKILQENYLTSNTPTAGNYLITLSSNEYYVLGDNRPSSLDSRSFGAISREDIVGRTWIRAWPVYKIRHFTSPKYNI